MNIGNYASALTGLPGPLGRATMGIQMMGTALKTMLANPILLAIAGVAGFIKVVADSVKTAKAFQTANADLAATLGVTRSETEDLQKSALELGKSTAFSAVEVANLQNEYAKLGYSQSEIIGLTASTIDLSVATRKGADETATYIGSVVNTYGLSASEATRVADVTAKAAASSALDFDKLSTAMPIVGATAKNAGVDLERVTAQLGVLSDRGIDASTSSTALRNIFLELAKRGMSYDEAMEKINASTNKNATAMELFGKRGATVATILSENTTQVDELEKVLDNAGGTAEKVAGEKLDTLEGSVTLMKSAWEGFKLTLTDSEGPIMKVIQAIVDITTGLINALSVVVKLGKAVNSTFAAVRTAVVSAFAFIISKVGDFLKSFEFITTAVEKVSTAFSGIKTISTEAFNYVKGKAVEFVNGLIKTLNKLPFFGDIEEVVLSVKEDVENSKAGDKASEAAEKAKSAWQDFFDSFKKK